jgi:hypothetical protein
MPYATYSTPVDASVETIWDLLLDKAQNPEKYIPYKVEDLKIHERLDNGLVREIKTAEMHMTERVLWDKDKGDVVFHVENHPIYSGTILNRVSPPTEDSGGRPVLTFTMDLKPRSPEAEQQEDAKWFIHAAEPEMIRGAVLHVKELMETAEQNKKQA